MIPTIKINKKIINRLKFTRNWYRHTFYTKNPRIFQLKNINTHRIHNQIPESNDRFNHGNNHPTNMTNRKYSNKGTRKKVWHQPPRVPWGECGGPALIRNFISEITPHNTLLIMGNLLSSVSCIIALFCDKSAVRVSTLGVESVRRHRELWRGRNDH